MSCCRNDGLRKENILQFDEQSKQVDFHFGVAIFSKRKKHVLCVSIEL